MDPTNSALVHYSALVMDSLCATLFVVVCVLAYVKISKC